MCASYGSPRALGLVLNDAVVEVLHQEATWLTTTALGWVEGGVRELKFLKWESPQLELVRLEVESLCVTNAVCGT